MTVLLYDHRYRPPKPAEQPEGELVAAFWSDGYVILRPAGTDKLQRGTIEPTAVDELLRRLKDVGFWGTELTRSVNSPPYEISITVFASGNPRTLHWDRVPNADKAPPACRQEQMEVVRVFPLAEKVIASCVPAAQLSAPDDKRLNEVRKAMQDDERRQVMQMLALPRPPTVAGQLEDFCLRGESDVSVFFPKGLLLVKGRLTGSVRIRNTGALSKFYLPFDVWYSGPWVDEHGQERLWRGIVMASRWPTETKYAEAKEVMHRLAPGEAETIEFDVGVPRDTPNPVEFLVGSYTPRPGKYGKPIGLAPIKKVEWKQADATSRPSTSAASTGTR